MCPRTVACDVRHRCCLAPPTTMSDQTLVSQPLRETLPELPSGSFTACSCCLLERTILRSALHCPAVTLLPAAHGASASVPLRLLLFLGIPFLQATGVIASAPACAPCIAVMSLQWPTPDIPYRKPWSKRAPADGPWAADSTPLPAAPPAYRPQLAATYPGQYGTGTASASPLPSPRAIVPQATTDIGFDS